VWVFKNASIFFNPDTQSYEDVVVNPARMDITAGKGSVIHVINTMCVACVGAAPALRACVVSGHVQLVRLAWLVTAVQVACGCLRPA
jgi:hypothetical protein